MFLYRSDYIVQQVRLGVSEEETLVSWVVTYAGGVIPILSAKTYTKGLQLSLHDVTLSASVISESAELGRLYFHTAAEEFQ